MEKVNNDILLYIFEILSPREREKIKTTCRKFRDIYIRSLRTRRDINPERHIFFRLHKKDQKLNQDLLFYEIDHTENGFVYFKGKRTTTTQKCKILYNKFGIPYCKLQNNFVYIYETKFKDEILKDFCERCNKIDFSFECGTMIPYCRIINCKQKPFCFKDPFNFTNLDIKNTYCRHIFCSKCSFKLSFAHSKNTFFNTITKTFIIKSDFKNTDFTTQYFLKNIMY